MYVKRPRFTLFRKPVDRGRFTYFWIQVQIAASRFLRNHENQLFEAILSAARASAVQMRLPEPEKLEETIRPPLAACWGES
jgi:hypothetical protein